MELFNCGASEGPYSTMGPEDLERIYQDAKQVLLWVARQNYPYGVPSLAMALGLTLAEQLKRDPKAPMDRFIAQYSALILAGAAGGALEIGLDRPQAHQLKDAATAAFKALEARGWHLFHLITLKDTEKE